MATTSVHEADSRGRRALHHAAYTGDKDLVQQLLQDGADVEAVTVAGSTALHIAAKAGHVTLLPHLITPTTLDAQNSQGFTPLQVALLYKQWEAAAVLVAAGASPYGPDSAPSLECPSDDIPAAGLLLKAMLADPSPSGWVAKAVNWKDSQGRTALHAAAAAGSEERASRLVKAGADKHLVDSAGATPLWVAAQQGHAHLVPLLATPCSLSLSSLTGTTPLLVAVESGDQDMLAALLAAGAPIDAAGSRGQSSLAAAAGTGSEKVVVQLLAAGAKVTPQDSKDRSALAVAAAKGHTRVMTMLLEALVRECAHAQQQAKEEMAQARAAAAAAAAAAAPKPPGKPSWSLVGRAPAPPWVRNPAIAPPVLAAAPSHQAPVRGLVAGGVAQQPLPQGFPQLLRLLAQAAAPLARELKDVPRCAQLLEVVLDMLGPKVVEFVFFEVRLAPPQEQHQASAPFVRVSPRNYLAEALLLGWLRAEVRRVLPARLQRLVPGLGTQAQKQHSTTQQQQQQQQQQQRLQYQLEQLMKEAVLEVTAGRQQQAAALLGQCAELYLQQACPTCSGGCKDCVGAPSCSVPPQLSPPELLGAKQLPVPRVVQVVHLGVCAAANAHVRPSGGGRYPCTQKQYNAFLAAWQAARIANSGKQPCQNLVGAVVAAVTAAELRHKQQQGRQQQQQQQQGDPTERQGQPRLSEVGLDPPAWPGPAVPWVRAEPPPELLADVLRFLRLAPPAVPLLAPPAVALLAPPVLALLAPAQQLQPQEQPQ